MTADVEPAKDRFREEGILRRRATLLAQPAQDLGVTAHGAEVLDFAVAGQSCLLGLEWVREVRNWRDVVPVPLAPPWVLGLVHLRGQMLPALDLGHLLGMAGRSAPPKRLLVLGQAAPAFAVAADVHGVRQLSRDHVERRSRPLEGLSSALVRGVTAEGELLLDGERLLGIDRGGPSAPSSGIDHP